MIALSLIRELTSKEILIHFVDMCGGYLEGRLLMEMMRWLEGKLAPHAPSNASN